MNDDIIQRVRTVLAQHGLLDADAFTLDPNAVLYDAGMNSRASVSVMLALESEFDIEFPDSMLNRNVFESIAAITQAVDRLLHGELIAERKRAVGE